MLLARVRGRAGRCEEATLAAVGFVLGKIYIRIRMLQTFASIWSI